MTIRVLLVDDHEIMRNGLHALLFRLPDIEVVSTVSDGPTALKETARAVPHVVIMDVQMPGMDGIEATRQLKEKFPHTNVLCLSMHRNSVCVNSAFAAGASGYLLKGSGVNELISAIRTISEGKNYLSSELADLLESGMS